MARQFLRNYRIIIVEPDSMAVQIAERWLNPFFLGADPEYVQQVIKEQKEQKAVRKNALVIQSRRPEDNFTTEQAGAQIMFSVSRTTGKNIDTMTLAVFNLSLNSREQINEESIVKLQVWYQGEDPITLFEGDVAFVETKKQGSDYITTLTLGDGYANIQDIGTIRSNTWPAGTSIKTIILDLTEMLGLDKGELVGEPGTTDPPSAPPWAQDDYSTSSLRFERPTLAPSTDFFSTTSTGLEATGVEKVIQSAYSFAGSAKVALDDILTSNSLAYSIQNRAVSVWPVGGSKADISLQVNQGTGLIGSPQYTKSKKGGDSQQPTGVSFQSIINPLYSIGRKVTIKSKEVKNECTITKVTHKGNYMGNEWISAVEGTIN